MIVKLASVSDVKPGVWHEYSLQTEERFVSVMLKLTDGQYFAYENSCPHQDRRMDYAAGQFLTTESGTLVCPAHGAEFDPESGLCVNGPCLGQSLKSVTIEINEEDIFAVVK